MQMLPQPRSQQDKLPELLHSQFLSLISSAFVQSTTRKYQLAGNQKMKITRKAGTHLPDNHILLSDVTSLEAAEPAGQDGTPRWAQGCSSRLCPRRTPPSHGVRLPGEGHSAPQMWKCPQPRLCHPLGICRMAELLLLHPQFHSSPDAQTNPCWQQLCWMLSMHQANPSPSSCNSGILELPSLPSSPMQHILLPARAALGPGQAPADHTPLNGPTYLLAPAQLCCTGSPQLLCLQTWPLAQADNAQHRTKLGACCGAELPEHSPTAPGSSRRQREAQLNSGSCSHLDLGTVSASWGLTEGCDEAPAARNANAPKATAGQGVQWGIIHVWNGSSYLKNILCR